MGSTSRFGGTGGFLGSGWGTFLKLALSLGILLWFGMRIDYAVLSRLLRDGQPAFLLALAAASLLRTGIGVIRFRILTDLLN